MKRNVALLAAVGIVAFAIVACDRGENGGTPTATAPVEPGSTPSETPASGADTGIPAVDAVIDAVHSGDPEAVRTSLGFVSVPCAEQPEDLPLCGDVEEPGTRVEALPVANCESSSFVRPGDLDQTLRSVVDSELYAVYRNRGQYVALFSRSTSEEDLGLALTIDEGHVVLITFGCAQTAGEMVEAFELEDAVLPPLEP